MASLEVAIERARIQLSEKLIEGEQARRALPLELITVEREDVTEMGLRPATPSDQLAVPYIEASLGRPSPLELHDTPTSVLAELVDKIVAIEGPVHVEEIVVRVRVVWGLQRAGHRIQTAVEHAVDAALNARKIERRGDFLLSPGAVVVPRDRSKVSSLSLRRPEMICPEEIDAALGSVLRDSFGATQDELIQSCSRLLGYAATSTQLRTIVSDRIDAMSQEQALATQGDLVVLKQQSK